MLFQYQMLSAYFDRRVGEKQDAESYIAIAKHLELPPAQVLFLTDILGGTKR